MGITHQDSTPLAERDILKNYLTQGYCHYLLLKAASNESRMRFTLALQSGTLQAGLWLLLNLLSTLNLSLIVLYHSVGNRLSTL